MHSTFTLEPIHVDDIVVYLKNERTGSSTTRKCKFVGQVIGFTEKRVKIRQLSIADQFATPHECKDYGEVLVYPHEIVNIIISPYQEDDHTRTLKELNNIIEIQSKDIYSLIGKWFCTLEDAGINPWENKECIEIANKNRYLASDYKKFLEVLV